MNHLSISFMMLKSKINDEKKAPIYARVKFGTQQINLSTKIFIEPDFWNTKKQEIKKQYKNADVLNLHIANLRDQIFDEYRGFLIRKELVDLSLIKNKIRGNTAENSSLITLYDEYIKRLRENQDPNHPTLTWKVYRTSKRRILAFLQEHYHCEDICVEFIDPHFVLKYSSFLQSTLKSTYTRNREMKTLRTIINNGLRRQLIKKDPYIGYKRDRDEKTSKTYLTKHEVKKIQELNLHKPSLVLAKDLFLFMCYTSLSYKDMITLEDRDITLEPSGKQYITKKRLKTRVAYKVPVDAPIQEIINLYKNSMESAYNGTIFPPRSLSALNEPLKEIAKLAGIEKKLSTHVGRHTFATLSLENGVPLETVSKMMAHASIKETENYGRITSVKIELEFNAENIFF